MSNLRISKKTANPILLPHGLIIAKALVFEINVSYLLQYLFLLSVYLFFTKTGLTAKTAN